MKHPGPQILRSRCFKKRKEVDAGNATVADLQIYLFAEGRFFVGKKHPPISEQADQETKNLVDKRRKSDETPAPKQS